MSYKVASVGDLVQGINVGAILTCKIVMHLDRPQEVPMSCLIVDSKNVYSVVSFYGTNSSLKRKISSWRLMLYKEPTTNLHESGVQRSTLQLLVLQSG